MEETYDVAIVGYGPTGVTAANLLGKAGLRVLVLERDRSLYERARAVSTDEEVLRIWQRVGLADRLQQDMLSGLPLTFVDANGETFLSFRPESRGNGYPIQLFIHQPALEEVLRDGVGRYPNVTVLLGHEVLSVRESSGAVEIDARAPDGPVRFRAAYVIAADGGSSPIRSQLGIGFSGRTFEDRWVVIDTQVLTAWPEIDRLRFHCDPRRPAVDCPTPLGHHRWEFPVLAGEDETALLSDDGVWRLLNAQGITQDHVTVLRAVVYSHQVRFAARWRSGRVFLAGDAAHVMPPWIGQGMAAGVRDAANLSWKLASVVRGELPSDVLDSYEVERQPHVRAISDASVFFGKVVCARRPAVVALRDPLFRGAMRAPFVGSYLRSADWFPHAHHPRGFRTGSKPARTGRAARLREALDVQLPSKGAVGWWLPQPWVLNGQGDRVRLDDALGDGWVVLSDQPELSWSAAGVPQLRVLPVGSAAARDAVVDCDDVLLPWLRKHSASRVAVRPDGFVYSAAGEGRPLGPPPPGLQLLRPEAR
ncbi:MAG: FAD-dependent oxidoreductase [Frankiales bacterium]|nr:FAD-dependent oxidoreductase [Frankiales bacterium]